MTSDAQIKAEADALTSVTAFLDKSVNQRGRTMREIADGTGLAIGRVQEICRKSEAVLKQRPRNRLLWFNDWTDVAGIGNHGSYRPPRKRGCPRKDHFAV